jgi:hypothetical protein
VGLVRANTEFTPGVRLRYFAYQLLSKTKRERDKEFKWFLEDEAERKPVEILTGTEYGEELQAAYPEATIVHDHRSSMETMIWFGYLE